MHSHDYSNWTTLMLLKEFFGRGIDSSKNIKNDKKDGKNINDDLFWYILDHDKIHKDYFMPLAKKIKIHHNKGKTNRSRFVREFMPMVKKGCLEYYEKKKMNGKPAVLFPKEFREEMCERLYDHYLDDIIKDSYDLGMTKNLKEKMLPKSAFAGTEKGYKLGPAGQLKGKMKRPAKAGDLVGGGT